MSPQTIKRKWQQVIIEDYIIDQFHIPEMIWETGIVWDRILEIKKLYKISDQEEPETYKVPYILKHGREFYMKDIYIESWENEI